MTVRAALAAVALLTGCAGSGPIVVPLGVDAGGDGATARAAAPPPPCRIAVAAVRDERSNRESIGAVGDRPIEAGDVRGWVARRLASLGTSGGPSTSLVTEVGIERVYARTVVTQLEGVVALRAVITDAGGARTERLYRGIVTRVNWAGTRHELSLLFDDALADAVARLAADAARLCR